MRDGDRRIAGPLCAVTVQTEGGMAVPDDFDIGGGRRVSPFAVAPWAEDAAGDLAALPPILRRLRGEWPCVPFGGTVPPDALPAEWTAARGPAPDWHRHDHGYGSNADWTFEDGGADHLSLSLDYPEGHPVARLERHIRCAVSAPRVEIDLTAHPRADATLPIGLHPVLRLPDRPGSARLVLPDTTRAWTFPVEVEPGRTALAPDQRDLPLDALKTAAGGPIDPTRLPWAEASEDLVLLTGTGGTARFENHAEGYAVTLDWDAAALPSLMLWISNRGRGFAPWNGRFRALGMEPVCAPFDLGPAFTGPDTPLARRGVATGVPLRTGQPWRTRLSVTVAALAAG